MPEQLGDYLRVNALRQQQGGAGVPEVVEAYLRQPGTPEERLEVAGHEVRVVGVPSEGVREDETPLPPGAVRTQAFRVLKVPVSEEAATAEWGRSTPLRLLLVLGA